MKPTNRIRIISKGKKNKVDEQPTGDLMLRHSAFRDYPPTIFFGRKVIHANCFRPSTMPYLPIALCNSPDHVVTKRVFKKNGFAVSHDPSKDFLIRWGGVHMEEVYTEIKPYQKYNHLPGAKNLGLKTLLNMWLQRARKRLPDLYDFHSETYMYPQQYKEIQEMIDRENSTLAKEGKPHKAYFLMKPADNNRGIGVHFVQTVADPSAIKDKKKQGDLVQKYINNPLLINGRKFDIRIHVLVTSISPLRVYVHKEGLVRVSTKKYFPPETKDDLDIHLTNVSVASLTGNFINTDVKEDELYSGELTLPHLMHFIKKEQTNPDSINNYRNVNVDNMWCDIVDIVKKTLAAVKRPMMPRVVKGVEVATQEMEEKCSPIPSKINPAGTPTNSVKLEGVEGMKMGGFTPLDITGHDGSSSYSPPATFSHHPPDSCFELFGFDFLVDDSGKVWLLEVNVSPSLEVRSVMDEAVRTRVLGDALNIVGLNRFCGARFESAVTGRLLTEEALAEERLKLSVDELHRSIGTGWERVFPDGKEATLELFAEVDPMDRALLGWCLDPRFEGSLAAVTDTAREILVENEREIAARHSSNPKMAEGGIGDIPA